MSVHLGFMLLLCCGWSLSHTATISETKKNYIMAFMENWAGSIFQLHLLTSNEAAKVEVTVKNPKFHEIISIGNHSSASLTLDTKYMLVGNEISSKVVMVTSDVDISVFGYSSLRDSADASFILPVEELGTEYFIFTPSLVDEKQFAVVSGVDRIEWVNITVSGTLVYSGKSYSTGDTINLSLEPYQVIQFQSNTDLTSTRVQSSAPVAVFTGHVCYKALSSGCDVLLQQLYPVQSWGTSFFVSPLANHTKDIIDIMAAYADTTVIIDQKEHTLQQGSHVQLPSDKSFIVNSSKPVWVSYLSQETHDPFLTTVLPLQTRWQRYQFVIFPFDFNYIMVVSPASSSASEFFLDQKPLSQYSFFSKEMNGFRIWEVSLGKVHGAHEIFHKNLPFSIYVYGFGNLISYGYTMGIEHTYTGFNCFSHGGEVHLPLRLVSKAKLNISDVHLKDPTCKGTKKGKFVVINVPFNKCGSKVLNENGKSVYVNTVYGTVPRTGVHRIEFPLKCEMSSNKTLGWNLFPQVTDMVSFGDYNVSLKFYHDETFTDPITVFPCEIDLHSRLYVEFEVESRAEDLQLFVENCQATPSLEETEENYNIIREGCSVDSTLEVHPVSDQRFQRFSFRVFKFNELGKVYLSCNTLICHNGTSPNRCTEGCIHSRRRRDVHGSKEHLDSARLSQGPFIVTNSRDPLSNSLSGYKTLAYGLIAVVGVMGTMSVMGLIILNRHYRRQESCVLRR